MIRPFIPPVLFQGRLSAALKCGLAFCFAGWCSAIGAQPPAAGWQVIETSGAVQAAGLKRSLKAGDALADPSTLRFVGDRSYALVYHPQRGRRLLPASYVRPAPESLNECARERGIALADSRRNGLCTLVDSLGRRLEGGRFLMLEDRAAIDLYLEEQLLRHWLEDAKFWLVIPQGKDSAWVRLPFNEGTNPLERDYVLYFESRLLYPHATKPAVSSPQLRPGSAGLVLEDFNGERHWVCLFEPVRPDDPQPMRQAAQALVAEQRGKGRRPAEIRAAVRQQLVREYGTPLEQDLEQWLRSSFNLSSD